MKRIVIPLVQWIVASIFLLTATFTYAGEYLSGPADYIYSPRVEEVSERLTPNLAPKSLEAEKTPGSQAPLSALVMVSLLGGLPKYMEKILGTAITLNLMLLSGKINSNSLRQGNIL